MPLLQGATSIFQFLTSGMQVSPLNIPDKATMVMVDNEELTQLHLRMKNWKGAKFPQLLDEEFFTIAQVAYDETIAHGMEEWGTLAPKGGSSLIKGYLFYYAQYVTKLEDLLEPWFASRMAAPMKAELRDALAQMKHKMQWALRTSLWSCFGLTLGSSKPHPILCVGFVNDVLTQMDRHELAIELVSVDNHYIPPGCLL
jgi:hypothetical protein